MGLGTVSKPPAPARLGAHYLLYEDGGVCYAQNGVTGAIDFGGFDHASIIHSAIDAAGVGGVLQFAGNGFSIGTPLRPKNKQTWWMSTGVIFKPTGDNSILDLSNIEQLSFHGSLQIEDPNGLSTSKEAIRIEALASSYFDRIVIKNYYNGIKLTGTSGGTHENHFNDIWMQIRNEGLSLETSCHDNKFMHLFIKGPAPDSWASGAGLRVETTGTQGGNIFPNIEILDMFRGIDLPGAYEIWFGTVVVDNAFGEGILVCGATERLFMESVWVSYGGDGIRLIGTEENPLTEFNIGQIYTWLNAGYGLHIGGHVEKFNFGIVNTNNNDKGLCFSGGGVRNGSIAQLISFGNTSYGVDGSGIGENVYIDRALISDAILGFDNFTELRGVRPGVGRFQNKGVAVIPCGETSVTVNHHLSGTPTVITLGPRHSEVSGAYVSERNAASFTIAVLSAVTGDREIDWRAEAGVSLSAEKVLNGDVEAGTDSPDHWYASAENAYWSTAEKKSGEHSLEIDVAETTGNWRAEHFAVTVGKTYRVHGFFKGIGSSQTFLTIRWFSNPDGTGFISENNIALDETYADWTLKEAGFQAPATAQSADIVFRAASTTTAHLYGDDFSVKGVL